MKYVAATLAVLALVVGGATAQQYPQTAPQAQQTVNIQNDTIPAGTQLSIRTNDAINADSQSVGQTYPAEIAQDVVDQNGNVVIPKGSPARLTIANVSS